MMKETTTNLFGNSGYDYAKRVITGLSLQPRLREAMAKAGFDPLAVEIVPGTEGDRIYIETIEVKCTDFKLASRAGEWLVKALLQADVKKYVEYADVAQPPVPANRPLTLSSVKARRHRPHYVGVELFIRFSGD